MLLLFNQASTVKKASEDEKKSKTTGKQETDSQSPLIASTDNSNDSLKGVSEEKKKTNQAGKNNNNKNQAISTSNKNAIKESSQTPTQRHETQLMTTKALQEVKDENVSHEGSISRHSGQKEADQMTSSTTNHAEIVSEKTETNKSTVSNVHENRDKEHEEVEGSVTQFHHSDKSSSLWSKEKEEKESVQQDLEQTTSKTVSSLNYKDKQKVGGEEDNPGVIPTQETDPSEEINRETIEDHSSGQETQGVS